VEYAPPGAADSVYCGMNVPPALIETVPLRVAITLSDATAIVPLMAVAEIVFIVVKQLVGVDLVPKLPVKSFSLTK
jgi:hypothetical protein